MLSSRAASNDSAWEVLDPSVLDLLLWSTQGLPPQLTVPWPLHRHGDSLGRGRSCSPQGQAALLQELGVRKSDKVLEIGTRQRLHGRPLAARAEHVVVISPGLAATAPGTWKRAGVTNASPSESRHDGRAGPTALRRDLVSSAMPALPGPSSKTVAGRQPFAAIVGERVMEAQLVTCTAPRSLSTVNLCSRPSFPALAVSPASRSCRQDSIRSLAEWLADAGRDQPHSLDVRELCGRTLPSGRAEACRCTSYQPASTNSTGNGRSS